MMWIHLLDESDQIIPTGGDVFRFKIYFPKEFNDTNEANETFAFLGLNRYCPADYWTEADGTLTQLSKCKIAEEFEGVNHKAGYYGNFKVVTNNIGQNALDMVDKIKVYFNGTYMLRDNQKKRIG